MGAKELVTKVMQDVYKTTGITAKDVQKHPDWYYGKTVTNYTSSNGQNDWKIFY